MSISKGVVVLQESYKFIRMADDLNDIATYLNDMRICFIALTVSAYVCFLIVLIIGLRLKVIGKLPLLNEPY